MPRQQLENLISHLHETFGDDLTSSQQAQLMQQMRNHVHELGEDDPIEPGMKETAELLLEEIQEQHPNAAAVVRSSTTLAAAVAAKGASPS